MLIFNTVTPQGCVLSPLLYSLSTAWPGTTPTPLLSLPMTTDNDETAYREEIRDLTVWCKDNNLSLNVIKTMEMIEDYRKRSTTFLSTGL